MAVEGLPPSPAGSIITTARRRGIDRLRREATRDERHAHAMKLRRSATNRGGAVADERLRLIFTCCHPALSTGVAGGADAAAARRTDDHGNRARVPGRRTSHGAAAGAGEGEDPRRADSVSRAERGDLPRRLREVLAVVYLIYNEGHTATYGDRPVRDDLRAEAIRLGRLVAQVMPNEPEVLELLALMLLTEARQDARA